MPQSSWKSDFAEESELVSGMSQSISCQDLQQAQRFLHVYGDEPGFTIMWMWDIQKLVCLLVWRVSPERIPCFWMEVWHGKTQSRASLEAAIGRQHHNARCLHEQRSYLKKSQQDLLWWYCRNFSAYDNLHHLHLKPEAICHWGEMPLFLCVSMN